MIRASAGPRRTDIRVNGAGFPIAVRRTGPTQAHLVGTGAWPLGGDHITCTVIVGAGATFDLTAVAAMVALPGPDDAPATVTMELVVEAGATLRFDPGPTIVAAGADLRSHTSLSVAAGGRAIIRELVLLGRHREPPGTVITRTDVTVVNEPVVRETLHRPAGDAAMGVDGGMRGLASLLVVGDTPDRSELPDQPHAPTNHDPGLHQAAWPLPRNVGWRAIAIGPKDGPLTAWSDASWKSARCGLDRRRSNNCQDQEQMGSQAQAVIRALL